MIATLLARAAALFAGHGLKAGMAAAALMMLITWDWSRINRAEQRGADRVRVQIEKNTDANAKKADAARAAAERIPADRLRDRYFRD